MMDLSTAYLGLPLRSPIVASSGPLTGRLEPLRQLEDAGIAAVVLPSLFEEQVVHDEVQTAELFSLGAGGNPEATSYFPDLADVESVTDRHVRHVEEARRTVEVPVIASLNGSTPGGWVRYAHLLVEAGADAIELNLYRVAASLDVPGSRVEDEEVELVAAIAATLTVPLAIKVSPYYSAFGHMATRLVEAGADGLVLFNRFYQPDIDPTTRRVVPSLELSTPAELRLPLRWTAMLHGRLDTSLAITSGVHGGLDVARALLAGADVAMMTSALMIHGPDHVRTVEEDLVGWAADFDVASVAELRGSASQRHVRDPELFERANYIEGLVDYTNTFASAQGTGPW